MSKQKGLKVILLASFGVGLTSGCAQPSQQNQASFEVIWEQNRIENERELNTAKTSPLPANYKEQIDEYFVATLKDPNSRVIEYTGNPYGSLVCGTVNAKNSFGGYVGRQPFFAYFSQAGEVSNISTFSSEELNTLKRMSDSPQSKLYDQVVLFKHCGFLH